MKPAFSSRCVPVALGCGSLTACATATTTPASTVATASYPLAWTVRQLAGPDVNVVDVVKPGVEPHDAELTVQQTADLTDADLVVYETGLSPAVDEVADSGLADDQRLEVSTGRRPPPGPRRPALLARPDPPRVRGRCDRGRVGKADPTHIDAYERRARALQEKLATLDGEFEKGLATCRIHTVVVSHEAFDYLGPGTGSTSRPSTGSPPRPSRPAPPRRAARPRPAGGHHHRLRRAARLAELADTLADESA